MTHFATLVDLGKPPKYITENVLDDWVKKELNFVLAPFDENLSVEPYIDVTKKELLETKEEVIKDRMQPDTEIENEKYSAENIKKMSLKEFAIWYYGGQEVDDDDNLLTEYNPRSKWDWWAIGGRYSGRLLNKKGKEVDIVKIKDLDFNRMQQEKRNSALEWYAEILEYVSFLNLGKELPESMKHMQVHLMFGAVPKMEKDDKDKLIVEEFESFFERVYGGGYFSYGTFIDKLGWHSETTFGWFGFSSGDEHVDQQAYGRAFEDKIKRLDADSVLVMVDIHI